MNYREELNEMRRKYLENPYKEEKLEKPYWMNLDDELYTLYKEYNQLFEKGKIYYGYIVQANEVLFESFPPVDCPANIVYCTDPLLEEEPYLLKEIAHKLYYYKGRPIEEAPNAIKEAVAVIKDEHDRKNFILPCEFDDGSVKEVHMDSIMIIRKYLPSRKLVGLLLPIIALPGELESIIVLPKQYWTQNMKNEFWGLKGNEW